MAGNYPDAPSWRMAWDRDGTQMLYMVNGTNVPADRTTAEMIALNDESNGGVFFGDNSSGYLILIFPELRDIDAIFFRMQGNQPTYQVSTDTTNGVDGVWTTVSTVGWSSSSSVKPSYRTGIGSSTQLAVRAIRFFIGNGGIGSNPFNAYALHLYGEIAPGQNPNRLDFWHVTSDARLSPSALDWGNVPRSSSADKTFRVKNLSADMTAYSIRVAMESLTDSIPSVPAQHTISYNGGAFLPQVNIGDLAPGAMSGPITLRRVTPSNATLSLWSFRVFAEPNSWS